MRLANLRPTRRWKGWAGAPKVGLHPNLMTISWPAARIAPPAHRTRARSAGSNLLGAAAAFAGTGFVQRAKTSARTAASRADVRVPPWQPAAAVGTAELAAKAATEFTTAADRKNTA
jgi:hypothetical protein